MTSASASESVSASPARMPARHHDSDRLSGMTAARIGVRTISPATNTSQAVRADACPRRSVRPNRTSQPDARERGRLSMKEGTVISHVARIFTTPPPPSAVGPPDVALSFGVAIFKPVREKTMPGRPRRMAKKIAELEERAEALSVDLFRLIPSQYRDHPTLRDPVNGAWNNAVHTATRASIELKRLGDLLRAKAGILATAKLTESTTTDPEAME
jgi:hypothetical protein